MKIQALKTFKWCIDGNIYPNDFLENNFYDVDDLTAADILSSGLAIIVKDNIETKKIIEVVENATSGAGWEEPHEVPFIEGAGSELSVLPQETALPEKIAEQPKKKGRKAGE